MQITAEKTKQGIELNTCNKDSMSTKSHCHSPTKPAESDLIVGWSSPTLHFTTKLLRKPRKLILCVQSAKNIHTQITCDVDYFKTK